MPDKSEATPLSFVLVQQKELRQILARRTGGDRQVIPMLDQASEEFRVAASSLISTLHTNLGDLAAKLQVFTGSKTEPDSCRKAARALTKPIERVKSLCSIDEQNSSISVLWHRAVALDQSLGDILRVLDAVIKGCVSRCGSLAKSSQDIAAAYRRLAEERSRLRAIVDGQALQDNLVGLAISGGGIRSATFGLGMLQALAELKLLKHVDYLSTVSGGGYIGSWFQACVQRARSLENVRRRLLPNRTEHPHSVEKEEPLPIRHLRRFSNYLTPKLGLFSADSWVVIAIYLRNLLATQCHLILVLSSILVLQRIIIRIFDLGACVRGTIIATCVAVVSTLLAAILIALQTVQIQAANSPGGNSRKYSAGRPLGPRLIFQLGIIVPLLVTAASVTWLVRWKDKWTDRYLVDLSWGSWVPIALAFAAVVFLFTLLCVLFYCRARKPRCCDVVWIVWQGLWKGTLSGLVCGSIFYLCLYTIHIHCKTPQLTAMAGPTLLLVFVALGLAIISAFQQSDFSEGTKEWFASLSGWLLLYAAAWLVAFLVPIYGGKLVLWLILPSVGGQVLQYLLGASWVGSTLLGVLTGKSPQTGDRAEPSWIDRAIEFLPHVFLAGMVIILSIAVGQVVEGLKSNHPDDFFDAMRTQEWCGMWVALLLGAGASAFFGWIYRVNGFSLHDMYANRLTRCYLGASRLGDLAAEDKRVADAVTGFDDADDLALGDLLVGADGNRRPLGPLPIINTALNLVGGDELAWQERKAESFTFTPIACGSKGTGYSELKDYSRNPITLGEVVAISGAAVSPNMGYHSSPSVAALLSAFNARLGGWYPNPNAKRTKANLEPPFGSIYFFRELFGLTTSRDKYVYLSDGGHFENLGIYELVRRRCRYILASDAGQDGAFEFLDLGNMIRKVRVDFGIRIDIDTSALRPNLQTGRSAWHCAVGRIRYSDIDKEAPDGILIYLKPSLSGDEPSDVLHYAAANPAFPHEDTVDQWFSESQFESYRALGFHVTSCALEAAVREVEEHGTAGSTSTIGRIFAAARRRWLVQPFDYDEKFLQLTERYTRIHEGLAGGGDLKGISAQIYPEAGQGAERAEIHVVCEMLQLMEDAWTGLRLDGKFDHSQNRGWLAVFRRWATSPLVRKHWLAVRGEFGQDFVRFCEREFALSSGEIDVAPIECGKFHDALKRIIEEIVSEWGAAANAWLCFEDKTSGPTLASVYSIAVSNTADANTGAPIGMLLLIRNDKDSECPDELVLWLLPAYRNLRLGAKALRHLSPQDANKSHFDVFRADAVDRKKSLIVRYPKSKNQLANERIERQAWQSFFEGFGFRKIEGKPDDAFFTMVLDCRDQVEAQPG